MEMAMVAEVAPATPVVKEATAASTTVANKPIEKVEPTAVETIQERQEVAMALSQANEILRQAKVARELAQKELEEAERKKLEAVAAKRQALEILKMAREAIKQLK